MKLRREYLLFSSLERFLFLNACVFRDSEDTKACGRHFLREAAKQRKEGLMAPNTASSQGQFQRALNPAEDGGTAIIAYLPDQLSLVCFSYNVFSLFPPRVLLYLSLWVGGGSAAGSPAERDPIAVVVVIPGACVHTHWGQSGFTPHPLERQHVLHA